MNFSIPISYLGTPRKKFKLIKIIVQKLLQCMVSLEVPGKYKTWGKHKIP